MLIAGVIACGLTPLAGIAAPLYPRELAVDAVAGSPGVSISAAPDSLAPVLAAERNTPSAMSGAPLHDNGPFITHPGGGAGGADASVLDDTILSIYGFGASASAGSRIADDFTVPEGGWTVEDMTFFTYQTNSPTTSTITGITVRIWDGAPGEMGSNVVFGDTTTNVMMSTVWSNVYRSITGDIVNSARPIMAVVADVGGVELAAGTYWVDFQFTGTLASGPWAPPITIVGQAVTGDALQLVADVWAPAVDGTFGHAAGFPFLVNGSAGGGGNEPTIAVDPAALGLTAEVDASDSDDLSISNTGSGVLSWSIDTAEPVAGSALAPRTSRLANGKVALGKASGVDAGLQGAAIASLGEISMSQTTSTAPVAGNSISCNAGGVHTDNSYFRRFYFDEHPGIGASATIDSVDVSVDAAAGAANSLTVNLYTIPGGTPVDTIPLDSLTLIGTSTLLVPPTSLGSINVPVAGNVPDTTASDLVVEVFTPDGQATGESFFIGATDTGQSHPGFLMAASCNIATPTDLTAIGFPDMHIIMAVNIGEGGPQPECDVPSAIPWLSATPALGNTAAGATDLSTITADATGLAPGTYDALLCVDSNDAANPTVVVPVEFTVEAGENDGIFCDGFELDGDGSCGGADPDPAPGIYTDRDEFLADVAPGFYEEAFTGVPVGDAGPFLDFSDGNFSYTVSVTESVLFNDTGVVSTGNPTDLLVVTFTGAPVTAVGGNFWGTDISFGATATDVTLTLSDGTVETFTATGPTSFRGFVTAAPITSITIDASDLPVEAYSTMDNLIVGD
jgi:hypothetical protein